MRAPYHGSTFSAFDVTSPLVGLSCAKARIVHPSSWDQANGVIRWGGAASVHNLLNCSPQGPGYLIRASSGSGIDLAVPLRSTGQSGTYTVNASWTLDATFLWSVRHATCPKPILHNGAGSETCGADARVGIGYSSLSSLLIDVSTGNLVARGSSGGGSSYGLSWSRSTQCSNNTCTTSNYSQGMARGNVSTALGLYMIWGSVNLNSSHHYEIVVSWSANVTVDVASYPNLWSASATASLDLATSGRGLFLSSVTIN